MLSGDAKVGQALGGASIHEDEGEGAAIGALLRISEQRFPMPRKVVLAFPSELMDDADDGLGDFDWIDFAVQKALDGVFKAAITELAEILAVGRL
jgi:hypothetical protein